MYSTYVFDACIRPTVTRHWRNQATLVVLVEILQLLNGGEPVATRRTPSSGEGGSGTLSSFALRLAQCKAFYHYGCSMPTFEQKKVESQSVAGADGW